MEERARLSLYYYYFRSILGRMKYSDLLISIRYLLYVQDSEAENNVKKMNTLIWENPTVG